MNSQNLQFSIVIPTYNRPDRLKQCLQRIVQVDYPRDRFQVIVVDDGSKVPLDAVVAPFQDQVSLTLLRQPNAGPAKARNTGAAHASGTYLVFTDDDCLPAPDWLSVLESRFAESPDALIGGKTLNALPQNLCSTASQLLIDYLYSYYNLDPHRAGFFASNNFALSREQFQTLGGFDTSFPLAAGEDREFCDRWLHHGSLLVYAPEMQIAHAHYLTLKSFWRQHFNYGRGAFCFHRVRSQRNRERIQVEPFSFYFQLLTYPFKQAAFPSAFLLSGLMFLSQVANVFGFFNEKWQSSSQPDLSVNTQS
jgi:glycosyltransferase involved in cell wall biosynthesis